MANTATSPFALRQQSVTSFFYFVENAPGGNLGKALEDHFSKLASFSQRNMPTNEGFRRIGDLKQNGEYWRGTMYRLRVNPDAQITNLSNEAMRSLGLQANEALAEYCGFLYYPALNLLVLHRNTDAGGHARFEEYLQYILGDPTILLAPVMNLDAYRRLYAIDRIQKYELKFANPESLTGLELPFGLNQQAKVFADQKAKYFEVTASVGNTKGSIVDSVKRGLEQIGKRVPQAERVKVTGKINGEEAVVDLLLDRMFHKSTVSVSGVAIAPTEIYSALVSAYKAREGELRVLFQKRSDSPRI